MRGRGSDETRRIRLFTGHRRLLLLLLFKPPGLAKTENRPGKRDPSPFSSLSISFETRQGQTSPRVRP